jgi:hypothetical protein
MLSKPPGIMWPKGLAELIKKYLNVSPFWRMASSGMLRRVALVRTDISEELQGDKYRSTRNNVSYS